MDRKTKMRDFHVHYTGSLPRKYLYKKFLLSNIQDPLFKFGKNPTFQHFSKQITSLFTKNYIKNREVFFSIYSFFQTITKPKEYSEYQNEYSCGCFEIARNFYEHKIYNFDLIAGPCSTIELTEKRLSGMIEGFKNTQNLISKRISPKIRLTFIRNSEGKIKNYSEEKLSDLFELLTDKYFSKWIVGFDISGEEFANNSFFNENVQIIKKLTEFNQIFNTKYDVSIHAGENINNFEENDRFYNYFYELTKLNISRISHGTFLWYNLNKKKEDLLRTFSQRKVIFDLCPKANLLLTPLKTRKEIPVEFFDKIGLKYTFNRDNPSIFNNINNP